MIWTYLQVKVKRMNMMMMSDCNMKTFKNLIITEIVKEFNDA